MWIILASIIRSYNNAFVSVQNLPRQHVSVPKY